MILDPTTVGTLIGVILITLAGSGIFVIRAKDGWKAKGAAEAHSNNVTIKHPVPTIQTREEQRWVPREEYLERWMRADEEVSRLWSQFGQERKIWNHEIESVQARLAVQSDATATLQGTVNEVNKTVGQLLSLALNRKPAARQ